MIGESLFEGVLSDGDDEDGAGEPGDDSKPEITDSEALLKFHDAERGYWWIKRVYWESGGHAVEWRGVKFDQNKRVVELQVELDKPGDSKSDDTSNEGSEESGEHYAASLVSFPGAGESSEDHGDLEIASSIFRWSAVQEQLSRVREYFGGTSPVSARDMEFVNGESEACEDGGVEGGRTPGGETPSRRGDLGKYGT